MAILDDLRRLYAAEKSFGAPPQWFFDGTEQERYSMTVPLSVDYVIEEGFYLEGNCLRGYPDENVSLSLVYKPSTGFAGPLERFDWKPHHFHENRGGVKGEWKWKRITGTHVHPFELNKALGWERMVRGNLPRAMPVPEPLTGFRDMLESVRQAWKIQDIQRIPVPEWQPRLT
jgi:hypothetical protein